jgi:hypothetical protein
VNAFMVIQWFGTGPGPRSLGEILSAITKDIATTEKNWTWSLVLDVDENEETNRKTGFNPAGEPQTIAS